MEAMDDFHIAATVQKMITAQEQRQVAEIP